MYSQISQEIESGGLYSNKRSNLTKYLTFGYMAWLTIACLSAFNLYLDYKCSYNTFVPQTYIHSYRSGVGSGADTGANADAFSKRSLLNVENGDANLTNTSVFSAGALTATNDTFQCVTDNECGHGDCTVKKDINGNVIGSECDCDTQYITVGTDICDYHQLSGLVALLLSIFLGGCGVDRCFISRGNGGCICLGILKALTLGGLGIWYIVDIVLIATANLDDGNGHALSTI